MQFKFANKGCSINIVYVSIDKGLLSPPYGCFFFYIKEYSLIIGMVRSRPQRLEESGPMEYSRSRTGVTNLFETETYLIGTYESYEALLV